MASVKQLLITVSLVVFVAIAVRHVGRLAFILGLANNKHNHTPGPCHYVQGIEAGSEDLHLLPNGFTFISTGLTWPYMPSNASVQSGIRAFDFTRPEDGTVWLPMEGDFDQDHVQSYHGISVWHDKENDEVTLFVIAHRKEKETVELFKFNQKARKLQHKKTIGSAVFHSLNDLVATGPTSFYATNDGCFRIPSTRERLVLVEMFLLWACGSIVYYDGNAGRIVDDGYVFPNGLQLSSDQNTLYVALYGENAIVVFKRNKDSSIEEIRRINVYLNADNINIDADTGDIWLGGPYHLLDMSVDPPLTFSSVVRIQPQKEDNIEEFYSDDGKRLLMVSGAIRYKKQLLIGTVAHKLLLCDLLMTQDQTL